MSGNISSILVLVFCFVTNNEVCSAAAWCCFMPPSSSLFPSFTWSFALCRALAPSLISRPICLSPSHPHTLVFTLTACVVAWVCFSGSGRRGRLQFHGDWNHQVGTPTANNLYNAIWVDSKVGLWGTLLAK